MQQPEKIFTVSEYIEAVNIALKKFKVKVAGEVTEVKLSSKGHIYFSLKDKKESVLECVVWKSNYMLWGVKLKEGIEVVVGGAGNIYAPYGKFSFIADSIALKGEGALKKAYEELKKKLSLEGLFSEERKRALPELPQTIGVITSKYGAAINDLLSNLGKFGFKIKLMDARVEGQEAVKDLLSALKSFKKRALDVLVIMRGGGSLESLQAFNNEVLVREVVDFPCPVIAAIGHEKDVPLLSLAADAACSTPTAAANLINKGWERAPLKIEQIERHILEKYGQWLKSVNNALWQAYTSMSVNLGMVFDNFRRLEQNLNNNLNKLESAIILSKKYLIEHGLSAVQGFKRQVKNSLENLYFVEKTILANDPEKKLALGYSIVRKADKLIKSIGQVAKGENIDIQVKDGKINSKVVSLKPKKYE